MCIYIYIIMIVGFSYRSRGGPEPTLDLKEPNKDEKYVFPILCLIFLNQGPPWAPMGPYGPLGAISAQSGSDWGPKVTKVGSREESFNLLNLRVPGLVTMTTMSAGRAPSTAARMGKRKCKKHGDCFAAFRIFVILSVPTCKRPNYV